MIALLFVVSSVMPSLFVSVLHLYDSPILSAALRQALPTLAALLYLAEVTSPDMRWSLAQAIGHLWERKLQLLAYLALAYAVNLAYMYLSLASAYSNSPPIDVALVLVGLAMTLSTFFLAAWVARGFYKSRGVRTRSWWALFAPSAVASAWTVFAVGILTALGLTAMDYAAPRVFPLESVRVMGTLLYGTFLVSWLLRHTSYRIHQFSATVRLPADAATEAGGQGAAAASAGDESPGAGVVAGDPPIPLKSTLRGNAAITALSACALAFDYLFLPGTTLSQMATNYGSLDTLFNRFLHAGQYQAAFAIGKTMQAETLAQDAYLKYEQGDFAGSQQTAQDLVQSDPGSPYGYLIDGYDCIRQNYIPGVVNDVIILRNLGHYRLATWLQYYADKAFSNSAHLPNDVAGIDAAGAPAQLLPFIVRTVPTRTAGQSAIIRSQLQVADLALIRVARSAFRANPGEGITMAQQLYATWPFTASYPVPRDEIYAEMWLAQMYAKIGDYQSSDYWLNHLQALGNNLTPAQNLAVQTASLAYSALPFNLAPSTSGNAPAAPTLLTKAMQLYNSDNIHQARRAFASVVQMGARGAQYGYALAGLALTSYKTGDIPGAMRVAHLATMQKDRFVRAVGYTVLGNITQDNNGPTASVVTYFRDAIRNNPAEYLAAYYMGIALQAKKRWIPALNAYRLSVTIYKRDMRSDMLYATGAPQENFGFTSVTAEGSTFALAQNGISSCLQAIAGLGG